jgi:hypothetical protein
MTETEEREIIALQMSLGMLVNDYGITNVLETLVFICSARTDRYINQHDPRSSAWDRVGSTVECAYVIARARECFLT